jgi:hypothetical protein
MHVQRIAMSEFISEDALDTWDGFLRFHHQDPATAKPEHLAHYRKLFETRAALPKFGKMKLDPLAQGEYRYAVALREGQTFGSIPGCAVSQMEM